MAKIAEDRTKMTLGAGLFVVVVCALIGPGALDAAEHKALARPSLSNESRNASLPATAALAATTARNSPIARSSTNTTSTTTTTTTTPATAATTAANARPTHAAVRKVNSRLARSAPNSLGDSISLDTAIDSHRDLMTAAGEHGKKYILVKKKPKHKKIKMEVYKPKMKYKKIKMKVPVKKLKKKKVKGYLVKKEKHHYR